MDGIPSPLAVGIMAGRMVIPAGTNGATVDGRIIIMVTRIIIITTDQMATRRNVRIAMTMLPRRLRTVLRITT